MNSATSDFNARLATLRQNGLQVLFGLVLALALALVLSFRLLDEERIDVSLGEPAETAIIAPQTRSFVSTVLTERAQAQAAAFVPEEFGAWDADIGRAQGDLADDVFAFIEVVRADSVTATEARLGYLQAVRPVAIDASLAADLLSLGPSGYNVVRRETVDVVDTIMLDDIYDDDTLDADSLVTRAVTLRLPELQERVVLQLAPQFVVPNRLRDEVRTEQLREAARASVDPVLVTVIKNEEIVSVGEEITAEDIEILSELGLLQTENPWLNFGRVFLVASLSVLIISLFGNAYVRERYRERRYMLVFFVLLVLAAFGASLMLGLSADWQLLLPLASLAMMLSVIFTPQFAMVTAVAFGILVGYVGNQSLELAVYATVGSLIAAFLMRSASRLSSIFNAGLAAGIVNVAVVFAFNITNSVDPLLLLRLSLLGIGSGFLSAGLAVIGFYAVGSSAGIITTLQLQDLSHFDHPLLTELLRRAPGTYHHSIMVANLAEQAAERIDADSTLVRVGAQYHDIGKMLRPQYFTENQEGDNPHALLDAISSARIIISHVTEGVEMARRYRLPQRIQDFILEHHGDRVLQHFYTAALEEAGAEGRPIPATRFQYPGPRPQSRETAIVAMADAIEATSSAVRPNNPVACEKLVNRIVDDLVQSGQLDRSGLTLNDIHACRLSFIETLQGRFHVRIKYAGNEQLEAANTPDVVAESPEPAPRHAPAPSAEPLT